MPSPKTRDYVVEKIISKRTNGKGQVFYLIKWKGYSSSDNTWEPEANVSNCPDMVKAFEAEQAKKTDSSTSATRASTRSTRLSLPSSTKSTNENDTSQLNASTGRLRKRASSNASTLTEDEDQTDSDFVTRASIKSTRVRLSKRFRKNTSDTQVSTPSTNSADGDILDIAKLDQILDVRRNPTTKSVEYHIQMRQKNKKSAWVSSDRLAEGHSQQVIDFLEQKYV